ncbi:hypothetical protein ACFL9T_20335 [Thermodesulfobacteriota bacterium]
MTGTRIIYDLCGGSGSWSKPDADDESYLVRVIDVKQGQDVRWLRKPVEEVHGVLAAPPCTHFSLSGARWWPEKDVDGRTLENIAIMDSCVRFIFAANPVWWCLENPVGRMTQFLGDPVMKFNPCDYGDPYTKKTCLWGKFNHPKKNPVEPTEGSKLWRLPPSENRAELRSITPPGFAAAFKEANP